MVVSLIITAVILAIAIYLLIVQLIKIGKLVALLEVYLRLLTTTAIRTNKAYKRIQEVDRLGAFEADDEVGFIFQEIKESVTELNSFLEKYIKNDEAKEK